MPMLEMMQRLRRLEIVYDVVSTVGAQKSYEEGFLDAQGKFVRTALREGVGLNTGSESEYAELLSAILPEALAAAIAANETMAADLAAAKAEIAALQAATSQG